MTKTDDRPAPRPCGPGPCAGLCTEPGMRAAYELHFQRLVRRARSVVGDDGLAEEAAQEAFVRAWRACCTYDPTQGPVISWLLVITRNVALDVVRARARRPQAASFAHDLDLPVVAADPTERLHLLQLLGDALAAIGCAHREAIVETVLRDRSYADVAAELGVPSGTLRSRVHYGMRQLRTLLEPVDALA